MCYQNGVNYTPPGGTFIYCLTILKHMLGNTYFLRSFIPPMNKISFSTFYGFLNFMSRDIYEYVLLDNLVGDI